MLKQLIGSINKTEYLKKSELTGDSAVYRILNKTIGNGTDSRDDGYLYWRYVDNVAGLYDNPTGWLDYPETIENNFTGKKSPSGSEESPYYEITLNTTVAKNGAIIAIPIYIQHYSDPETKLNDEGMLFKDSEGNYHPRYEFEISEKIDYSQILGLNNTVITIKK